ncbi:MAG TPA: cell wall hydrolase, partial [Pseudomonas sp.]|nr:cell wall hydrolase [Pseudomonas sp.]
MTATEKDRDVLARTLWGEARGEGLPGQIAVAWAIRNRVNDGKARSWWGEGYAGVCQAPYQFSCWNKSDPNFVYLSGSKPIPAGEFARA